MLNKDMSSGGNLGENVVVYNQANKEVIIICNHQRKSRMMRLNEKIEEPKCVVEELETDLGRVRKGKRPLKGSDGKSNENLNHETQYY
ncbi:hypothetical protein Lser_V15G16661 [Lactuca serriola]